MKLEVRNLSSLKPHEDILVDEVKKLKDAMLSSGVQMKPLIIDEATGVIIDGAHRYNAMLELGLKYAVVYSLDYTEPKVEVKRWIPCSKQTDLTALEDAEHLDLKKVELEAATSLVDEHKIPFALLTKDASYLSTKLISSPLESYWSGWHLFQRIASTIHFLPDSEDMGEMLSKFALILYRPTLDKKDVIKCALSKKLYPPKSTRHVLPFKPKDVCFRLMYLKGEQG
ncbi:MAG: ParB N-terminal domain-containing protein [Nitrososphaerales archaeon]